MHRYKKMTNCPNCSSNKISYDIKTQSLKCEHCNQKIESKKAEKKIKELDTIKGLVINEKVKAIPKSQKELFAIKCTKCEAIKYVKDKTKYTYCRLCGNKEHEVLSNNIEEPKYILPFLLNREEVYAKHKNALNQKYMYSDRKFLDNFKQENLIGVYVPYRVENNKYVCDMYGEAYATYEILKNDSGTSYTALKFQINRNVEIEANDIYYDRVDEDISTRENMIENVITEVSPYDMKEKIELNKDYLDEYIVLKTNETSIPNAVREEKLNNIAKYAVIDDVLKYDYGIIWNTINCNILKTEASYVYIPIWLYYKSQTKNNRTEYYYVAINGRTNEIGMHLPFNEKKAIITSAIQATLLLLFPFWIALLFVLLMKEAGKFIIGEAITYFVFLAIFIFIVRRRYNIIKSEYEGDNIINENDKLIDYKRKILHRAEKRTGKIYSSWPEKSGRNDNINI